MTGALPGRSANNVRPGSPPLERERGVPGRVRFRKHHRPCGQPAVDGGRTFRPLPLHAGHFTRINATPSDLPLMSTGRARYPLPPQRGQSFGSTLPPRWRKCFTISAGAPKKMNFVTKTEQSGTRGSTPHAVVAFLNSVRLGSICIHTRKPHSASTDANRILPEYAVFVVRFGVVISVM